MKDGAPMREDVPVAVLGAGPIGLAAAAHLVDRGLRPLVLEAGRRAGTSIAAWAHVRLFSPWQITLDPVSVRMLSATGWTAPDLAALPTGGDLLDRYLQPLAALPELAGHLRFDHRVVAVARRGMDKVRTPERESQPFLIRVRLDDGTERELAAQAVIDATGTWSQPNPLGASGLPALGELQAADRIVSGIPDLLGGDRGRYAGRRVVVVGSGHSAATSLLALGALQARSPRTEVVWAVRSATPRPLVGKGEDDELAARGRLNSSLQDLVATGRVELVTGFRTHAVRTTPAGLLLLGADLDGVEQTVAADLVVNATGFRPDHSMARELRLELDPALECPPKLAPLIDPNVHSCGTVPAHGAAELAHPEPGYFTVGMKSYGRAPTFLLATGYEQVRSVVAAIAGDHEATAARAVSLPETGVCQVDLALAGSETSGGCAG